MTVDEVKAAFEATEVGWIFPAADQDGHDGGFIATDGEREAWGETEEEAEAEAKWKPIP